MNKLLSIKAPVLTFCPIKAPVPVGISGIPSNFSVSKLDTTIGRHSRSKNRHLGNILVDNRGGGVNLKSLALPLYELPMLQHYNTLY